LPIVRGETPAASQFGMLLAGLYVLALMLWTTWSGWFSIRSAHDGSVCGRGSVVFREEHLSKLSQLTNEASSTLLGNAEATIHKSDPNS